MPTASPAKQLTNLSQELSKQPSKDLTQHCRYSQVKLAQVKLAQVSLQSAATQPQVSPKSVPSQAQVRHVI